MGIGAATVDRVDSALPADVDEAVARLLASAVAGAQMVFLDDTNRLGALPAVIGWPAPEPLLADVCTMFERFGLRVARQQRLNRPEAGCVGLHLFEFTTPEVWLAENLGHVAEAFESRDAHGFAIDNYAGLIVTANVTWQQVVPSCPRHSCPSHRCPSLGAFPGESTQRAGRRPAAVDTGCWGIFGHGNVAGVAQALLEASGSC